MFSFKRINKNKIDNYKACYLCLPKIFYTLAKTFANIIASVIPAASKPLIMELLCFLRWLYVSAIHLA